MGISFIIPFYDERIFLRQTLDSIVQAGDIVSEIIVVNDHPTDNAEFLNEIKADYSGLFVLNNEINLGASGSRNRGIDHASAEHIVFIDSDDFFSPEALRAAYQFARATNADMTHMPTLLMFPANGEFQRYPRDLALLGRRLSHLQVHSNPEVRYAAAAWAFLYKRDFLIQCNIRFDRSLRKFEDHLFILGATQKAPQISTFNQWVHVWRRRGGSLSTGKMNWSDFDLQIESFEKCTRFLANHADNQSPEFQRDLAFCFNRFISHWPLLGHCLPRAQTSAKALQTLNRLADAAEAFPMTESICDDELLRALLGPTLRTFDGVRLDAAELPSLYQMASNRDWSSLGKKMLAGSTPGHIAAHQGAQQIGARLKLSKDRVAPEDDETDIWRLRLQHVPQTQPQSASKSAVDTTSSPSADLAFDPVGILWDIFVDRLSRPNSRDTRLFSEFLLDDLDAWIEAIAHTVEELRPRYASVRLRLQGETSISNFSDTLKRYADNRFGANVRDSTETQTHNPNSEVELTVRIDRAASMTRTLIAWALDMSDESDPAPSRQIVMDAWRACEESALPNLSRLLSAELIMRADSSRFGDADWWGRRTLKSRLRWTLQRAKETARAAIPNGPIQKAQTPE